jgi:hypothetical protein
MMPTGSEEPDSRAVYGAPMHAIRTIKSADALREIVGEPTDLVRAKLADRLNDLTRQSSSARRSSASRLGAPTEGWTSLRAATRRGS